MRAYSCSLAVNVIIAMILLSCASSAGKGPAGKAAQYGFTMLLSLAHFAVFAAMFFAPAWFAQKVLESPEVSQDLIVQLQLGRCVAAVRDLLPHVVLFICMR